MGHPNHNKKKKKKAALLANQKPPESGKVTRQENATQDNKNARFQNQTNGKKNPVLAKAVAPKQTEGAQKASVASEHTDNANNQQDDSEMNGKKDGEGHGRGMFWTNVVMAGATTIAACIAAGQLYYIRKQLDAMTAQLIAMNKQSDTMSGQLDQMKSDSNSTTIATDRQLKVLDGQLDQMRIASRAWVVFAGGKATGLDGTKKIECEMAFTNSGGTPANTVRVGKALWIDKPDCNMASIAEYRSKEALNSITSERPIAPQAPVRVPATFDKVLSKTQVDDIRIGQQVVYIFGTVSYLDVFNETRTTDYCCTVDPTTGDMRVYKQHNRVK